MCGKAADGFSGACGAVPVSDEHRSRNGGLSALTPAQLSTRTASGRREGSGSGLGQAVPRDGAGGHGRCPCCNRSTGRDAGAGSTPGQVSPGPPLEAWSAGSARVSQAVHRLSPQRWHRAVLKAICRRKAQHRFSAKPSLGLSQEMALNSFFFFGPCLGACRILVP